MCAYVCVILRDILQSLFSLEQHTLPSLRERWRWQARGVTYISIGVLTAIIISIICIIIIKSWGFRAALTYTWIYWRLSVFLFPSFLPSPPPQETSSLCVLSWLWAVSSFLLFVVALQSSVRLGLLKGWQYIHSKKGPVNNLVGIDNRLLCLTASVVVTVAAGRGAKTG